MSDEILKLRANFVDNNGNSLTAEQISPILNLLQENNLHLEVWSQDQEKQKAVLQLQNEELTGELTYVPRRIDPPYKDSNSILDRGIPVNLQPHVLEDTPDICLWKVIDERCKAINFGAYHQFINRILCENPQLEEYTQNCAKDKPDVLNLISNTKNSYIHHSDTYELLDKATECFLMHECGMVKNTISHYCPAPVEREKVHKTYLKRLKQNYDVLPYFELVYNQLQALPIKSELALGFGSDSNEMCYGIHQSQLTSPCLMELIWSYWMEEGFLVQTLNAIALRFQNRRLHDKDPLGNLEIDPLRPLNNLLWGYIQEDGKRLTIARRAYEYDHHYGISLQGKAVPTLRSADSRSRFLEAFHRLLYQASVFFKEMADTTIKPDAFPLSNALQEVHLILAEGAHNQFGDLPWTARKEMLMMQWLLARPEMREFLGGRVMVPHQEPWMERVDAMKRLQGWGSTSVSHFSNLAVEGEKILLSVRYGSWTETAELSDRAANWAHHWRESIQRYIHSYQAVTGVNLRDGEHLDYTPPSVHLSRRLKQEQRRA